MFPPKLTTLMYCLRLLLYRASSFCKQCVNPFVQMWMKNNVQNFYSSLSRSRKILLSVLILCIVILYSLPSWVSFNTNQLQFTPLDLCIESKLEKYRQAADHHDATITYKTRHIEGQTDYLSYIGNGHIATAVDGTSKLHVKLGSTVGVPVNFYPIITINIEGFKSSEAHVTDIRSGLLYRVQCFESGSGLCINAASQFYAHKSRPGVLVQEFRIENPTDNAVTIDLEQVGVSGWDRATTIERRTSSSRRSTIDYKLTVGSVPVERSGQNLVLVVAIANVNLPETVSIKPGGTWKYQSVSCIRIADKPVPVTRDEADKTYLTGLAIEDLTAVLNIDDKLLREEHMTVWNKLWQSGFGISQSLAAGALNGDRINTTMYYVLSNTPSPIYEIQSTPSEKGELERLLYFPDRCYEGHHTLQNSRLWETANTIDKLNDLVKMWFVTLEKQGCSTMLQAGADGVIQAMMLSFGGLKFNNHHLEFNTEPKDLHRDYFFRRINYGNNTHVNISVTVGEDNKATLYVALDRNDRPYYACDAGCIDAPVKLSNEVVPLAVKLTQPLTAILYITSDLEHMDQLKHVIHVREIGIAPAHEHHVIALHKHGHHYGGLPMLFWISIGFLITIFHLFLFKLIFNEYCNTGESRYVRANKYSL